MKIVTIKGTNGSGKTTIAKQLVAASNDVHTYWLHPPEDPENTGYKLPVTVLMDLGWALVGSYEAEKAMGGCDTIKRPIAKILNIKYAIDVLARKLGRHYWILFEGMMIGTIKSTFYDYLLELKAKYPEKHIKPLFVFLDTDIEACMRRMHKRNPKSRSDSLKANVAQKIVTIERHRAAYDPRYCAIMDVDNIAEKDMLKSFLEVVGDVELLDGLYGH